MTILRGLFPTRRFRSAIRRESIKLGQKCALIIIDEDGKDSEISDEIEIVKRCTQKYGIPAYIFFIGGFAAGGAAEELDGEGECVGRVNKSILLETRNNARYFAKYTNSCFGDFGKFGSDLLTPEFDLRRSTLYKDLQERGVQTLIITGRYRASCIMGTATHAMKLGFKVLTASTVVFGDAAANEDWMKEPLVEWYTLI